MNTNTRHWSDAWGTLSELAARLDRCALQLPVVTTMATALRSHDGYSGPPIVNLHVLHDMADTLREHAERVARRWEYEDFAALTDAADALDELADGPVPGLDVADGESVTVTGEFR